MSATAALLLFIAVVLLSALGLVAWGWMAMVRVEEAMRSLTGYEGMDFEVWPPGNGKYRGTEMANPWLKNNLTQALRREA